MGSPQLAMTVIEHSFSAIVRRMISLGVGCGAATVAGTVPPVACEYLQMVPNLHSVNMSVEGRSGVKLLWVDCWEDVGFIVRGVWALPLWRDSLPMVFLRFRRRFCLRTRAGRFYFNKGGAVANFRWLGSESGPFFPLSFKFFRSRDFHTRLLRCLLVFHVTNA